MGYWMPLFLRECASDCRINDERHKIPKNQPLYFPCDPNNNIDALVAIFQANVGGFGQTKGPVGVACGPSPLSAAAALNNIPICGKTVKHLKQQRPH